MATLTDLRNYVRSQTETTERELGDVTIDPFIREAFDRTVNRVNKWPFYETQWVLHLPAGGVSLDIPSDVNQKAIASLINQSSSPYRMQMVDQELAEDLYIGSIAPGRSMLDFVEFSIWGNKINLSPLTPLGEDRNFLLRGWRMPRYTWMANPAEEIDIHERLQMPLAHYAIALAYVQQEDEQLEDRYMTRYQIDVDTAINSIMEPVHDLPLTMGGGKRRYRV